MKINHISLCVLATIFSPLLYSQSPSFGFIDEKFDDFVTRFVPEGDRENFSEYYNAKMYKLRQAKPGKVDKKRQKNIEETRQLGWDAFQVKNSEFTAKIKHYVGLDTQVMNQENKKLVDRFLFRFGTLEEFVKQKAEQKNGLMAKARSYVRGVGSKVTNWFGGLRKSKPA